MRSKSLISSTRFSFFSSVSIPSFCGALIAALALTSCSDLYTAAPEKNEMTIGEKLESSSALSDSSGQADRTQMVFFDKTVRRIHHFDLTKMSIIKTLSVDNPSDQHSVLFDQNSGLIVDFSSGHMTLFDREGNATKDPLVFAGRPFSAAYRPSVGTLVVYDDSANVGILKLDTNGRITTAWMGGSLLSQTSGATIKAGDLNDQDQLILALSDQSIAIVDIAQTLAAQEWRFTSVATTLSGINWLAPIRGSTDKVMVVSGTPSSSSQKISVVSLTDGSATTVTPDGMIERKSKNKDPHVLVRSNYGSQLKLYFASPTGLEAPRTLSTPAGFNNIMSSRFSRAENIWTFLDAKSFYSWSYNSYEYEYSSRKLFRYRVSDMLALPVKDLPDKAEISVSNTYAFALYPSKLGFAQRLGINDPSTAELKLFNLGHIGR